MLERSVNVTLLDDTLVTGRLVNVDGFLNMELNSGVTVISADGYEQHMDVGFCVRI